MIGNRYEEVSIFEYHSDRDKQLAVCWTKESATFQARGSAQDTIGIDAALQEVKAGGTEAEMILGFRAKWMDILQDAILADAVFDRFLWALFAFVVLVPFSYSAYIFVTSGISHPPLVGWLIAVYR